MNVLQKLKNDIKAFKQEIVTWDREFYEGIEKNKAIAEAISRYNPETDIIVSKSELDITNQLKNITKKLEEVHSVHTGKYFEDIKKEKPLTRRQREKIEVEEMKNFALNKAVNRVR